MSKAVAVALAEVGYLEKASNANLDSKTDNAGRANYTKYAHDLDAIPGWYNGKKNGYAWCAVFVDWCFVQAYGVDKANKMTCHTTLGAGCDYAANAYKSAGRWHTTPKVGDEVFFRSGSYSYAHTGLVVAVDSTTVTTVEGNTSGASGVISNGGGVCKKTYKIGSSSIVGYGRPDYDLVKEETTVTKKVYLSPSNQTANTYSYGNTTEAVQCGYIAEACKKALERSGVHVKVGHYDTMKNRCKASDDFGADVHVPIHTNAFDEKEGQPEVMGTRIFSYDTKGKGWKYANAVFEVLAPLTPGKSENVKPAPQLYEVKTPKAPTVYVECEFHDNPEGAKWIIEHTIDIGEAIAKGLCNALGVKFVPVKSADTGEDVVSRAEYEELLEKYNTLQAGADALRTRVLNAVEAFDKGEA